jgi:RNA polymerase sigma factor (sigma-70 family)
MPDETVSSMHDARDAEDRRLLESGNHRQLLENYVHLVREWSFLRTRDRVAADEVAQQVFLRLAEELERGKRYTIPFRVVVWKVVQWTAAGFDWRKKPDATLPEGWDPPDDEDEVGRWAEDHDLRALLADLPEGQRAVAELVYLEGLAPEQVAERLRLKPNAVYQRLHNAHKALAGKLVA